MGTDAHVVVVGAPAGLRIAEARLRELEAKWSRFVPTSELSRLNAVAGRPAVVSRETFDAIALAVQAWHMTAGRFDPTVLSNLVAAGYDRSLDAGPGPLRPSPGPAPGCADIGLAASSSVVTLPIGVGLDLGGIGKGFAADIVASELLAGGAAGACINVGGDLRVGGEPPTDDGWVVAVEHPSRPDVRLASVVLVDGAAATTTSAKRRWQADGQAMHHLIDPALGRPAAGALVSVTIAAPEAWRAEVLAKVVFLDGVAGTEQLLRRNAARIVSAVGEAVGVA